MPCSISKNICQIDRASKGLVYLGLNLTPLVPPLHLMERGTGGEVFNTFVLSMNYNWQSIFPPKQKSSIFAYLNPILLPSIFQRLSSVLPFDKTGLTLFFS